MKPSDSLFKLIKSLDSNEKGYFKKFNMGYGKNTNYLQLFDVMDQQEVYDEALLLKKFKGKGFVKQFSVTKGLLWDMILKSQRQYRAENSKFMILNTLMENGEILFEKGLYEDALKIWGKAETLAETFDEKPFILDIETAKRRYYIDMTAGNWKEHTDPSYDKSFQLLKQYELMLYIQKKYVHIVNFIKTQPFFRNDDQKKEWDLFMQDPVLSPDKEPSDFYARLYFNYIHNIYHLLNRNKPESMRYMKRIVDAWDANPEIKELETVKYISAVYNYLSNLLLHYDFDAFNVYFEKLSAPKLNSPAKEAIYFEHWWLLKYAWLRIKLDIEGTAQFIEETKADLEKYTHKINKVRLMLINFGIGLYYATIGDHRLSNDYIQNILDSKEIELRKDIQSMSRIVFIVNHYEQGNTMLMEHLTRASKRFMKSNDSFYNTERAFIKHILNAVKAADRKEKIAVFKKMFQEISEIFESNISEQQAFDSIRLLNWVQTKIEEVSHLEILNRNSNSNS